jgi:hypothetical protein
MKSLKLGLFISISLLSLTFFSEQLKAEILPNPTEVGNLMGLYMCKSLIQTGSLDSDENMELFAFDMYAKYGEEKTLEIMEKIDSAFNSEKWTNDPYVLELMRGVFRYIIDDDNCFETFAQDAF